MKNYFIILITIVSTNIYCQENSIFWKIEKDSIKSFILGTNHIFGEDFIEKNDVLSCTLKKSEMVLIENIEKATKIVNSREPFYYIDSLSIIQNKILSEDIIDKKVNVEKLTIRELYLFTESYWDKLSCLNKNEKKYKYKMDTYIMEYCLSKKKTIIGLENISETLNFIETGFLEKVDEVKIIGSLKYKLNAISKNQIHDKCLINELYRNKKYKYDFNSDIKDGLLFKRNQNWLPKIITALKTKQTVFIAVGVAHLDYKSGLITLLQEKGYTVTPIQL